MPVIVCALAVALSLASALAAYARSAHCRWPVLRRMHRSGAAAGVVLASAASVLWIVELGVGAGLCAMVGCWMLAAIVLPYLAWMRSPRSAAERR